MLEYAFRRNIIYFNQGRVVGAWDRNNRNATYDRNLYWNTSGEPLLFGKKNFAEWQAAGKDLHSIIADRSSWTRSTAISGCDQAPQSAQIGFEPWDLSSVGPRPSSAASQ